MIGSIEEDTKLKKKDDSLERKKLKQYIYLKILKLFHCFITSKNRVTLYFQTNYVEIIFANLQTLQV